MTSRGDHCSSACGQRCSREEPALQNLYEPHLQNAYRCPREQKAHENNGQNDYRLQKAAKRNRVDEIANSYRHYEAQYALNDAKADDSKEFAPLKNIELFQFFE